MPSKYAKALRAQLKDWQYSYITEPVPIDYTPESLARLYAKVRSELDALENVRYWRQVRANALEQMLIESHEQDMPGWGRYGAGADTVKLPSGSRIDVGIEPDVKVEDKERFRKWCIANGLEGALQLWPSTTASITKERLLAGVALPDGVAVTVRQKIKFRKPKGETE